MTAEMLIHGTIDDETTLAEEEALQTVEEERAELQDLQEVGASLMEVFGEEERV